MRRRLSRLLVVFALVLFASACATTRAGRKRQKVAIASGIAVAALVVGLVLLEGAATTCEDTGDCPTPNGPLGR